MHWGYTQYSTPPEKCKKHPFGYLPGVFCTGGEDRLQWGLSLLTYFTGGCFRMAFQVTVHADKTTVKRVNAERVGGGRRGKIAYFSRASRRRMLGLLAECREDFTGAHFVTLTYPAQYPTDPHVFKRHLDSLLKRWARYSPAVRGIWRLEFQRRGAPHYHLLVWGLRGKLAWLRGQVSRAWYSIVASGDEKHLRAGTNVQVIESRKHAGRYVSKYAAKPQALAINEDTGEVIPPGRFWGSWGNLDRRQAYAMLMTDTEAVELKRILRHILRARGRGKTGKSRRYAAYLARMDKERGWHILGIGDMSCELWQSTTDSTIWAATMAAITPAAGG